MPHIGLLLSSPDPLNSRKSLYFLAWDHIKASIPDKHTQHLIEADLRSQDMVKGDTGDFSIALEKSPKLISRSEQISRGWPKKDSPRNRMYWERKVQIEEMLRSGLGPNHPDLLYAKQSLEELAQGGFVAAGTFGEVTEPSTEEADDKLPVGESE